MAVAVLGCAALVVPSLSAVAAAPEARAAAAFPADPAAYVNPMIGTGVGGKNVGSVNTFPGPVAPSGMIQWSPDTAPGGEGDPAGYLNSDSHIAGFSLTHLSGPGCYIFRDFEFLPTTKPVTTSPGTGWNSNSILQNGWAPYIAPFSHSQETAKPGYYSVDLQNPAGDIGVQLTAARRAAMGRFTFPAGQPATMLIDTSHGYGDDGGSSFQVVSPNTIVGSASGGHFCGHPNWPGNPAPLYTVHFAVTFDHPFTSYGTWQGSTTSPGSASASGKGTGGWVNFDTSSSAVVGAKVAISYVSTDGAQANMNSATSDFDTMQAQTYNAWNSLLGRIGVSGGSSDEETTFYTALYHAMVDPSVFSDADGQYMGFDFKVHTVPPGREQYANFSGWDIYRSEVPLLAMLQPDQTSDMMQSLVNDAEQGGWLPKWPTANLYTGMMGGDAADPMIADAYAFGAQNFDLKTALQYMLKGANDTTSPWGQGMYSPRESYISQPEWGDYLQRGYVRSGTNAPFGTALTEEFSLADFAISQFATAAGDPSIQSTYQARGQNWQNVFDPGSGYMQPRGPGALPPASDPSTQTEGMEEGNAAQYTWMVPQNFAGLFAALGGRQAAASRLDTFFTQLNAGSAVPYDWQGNEVTLDSPWAYDYLGQPWKTQNTVRNVITQLYGPTPGGEPGNDDLGAMSSWYVWAALGMYPETPGTGTLALGSPLFPSAVIHLANGKDITINAPNAAPGAPYVQGLQINGQDWPKNYLSTGQYSHGATLDYDLATTPSTSRGTGPEADPPSYTSGEASAIGFTSPWGAAEVSPGQSTTIHVGAKSEVQQPQTVTWTATAPSGIQVTPSSGTLTLQPDGQATMPASVSLASTVTGGVYPVHFSFTGSGGRRVTSADLEVTEPIGLTPAQPDLVENTAAPVELTATNETAQAATTSVALAVPSGWSVQPASRSLTLAAGQSQRAVFTVTPPAGSSGQATLHATAQYGGATQTLDFPATVDKPVAVVGNPGDMSNDQFALAPNHYSQYPAQFPGDVDFTYGTSNPATDWSYIQPGPADSWGGSKSHTFTYHFNLAQSPPGNLNFTAWLLDSHPTAPPTVRIGLNGTTVQTVAVAAGGGDGYHWGDGKPNALGGIQPSSFQVPLPASALQAGENTVTITTTASSWMAYDAFGICQAPA